MNQRGLKQENITISFLASQLFKNSMNPHKVQKKIRKPYLRYLASIETARSERISPVK